MVMSYSKPSPGTGVEVGWGSSVAAREGEGEGEGATVGGSGVGVGRGAGVGEGVADGEGRAVDVIVGGGAFPFPAHVCHCRFGGAADAGISNEEGEGRVHRQSLNRLMAGKVDGLFVSNDGVVDAAGRTVMDLFYLVDEGADASGLKRMTEKTCQGSDKGCGHGRATAEPAGYRDGGTDEEGGVGLRGGKVTQSKPGSGSQRVVL